MANKKVTRKEIKAKANKATAKAVKKSERTSAGNWNGQPPAKGHVKKAKYHKAEKEIHRQQSRLLNGHTNKGKKKVPMWVERARTPIGRAQIAREDKAAAAHEKAQRLHTKAAKTRRKK